MNAATNEKNFPPALAHGPIEEVFPGVFFVTGAMQAEFGGVPWQFSRNMTVIRDGNELTIVNSVRLDDAGLAALDKLGKVAHVMRIGSLHGRDDPFYVDRYDATYWAAPNMPPVGIEPDKLLGPDCVLPIKGASLFEFRATKLPEVILRVDREGGILVACDALQNWLKPDGFFEDETCCRMKDMGFFQPANLGVVWVQVNEPQADDFVRLNAIPFRHVLCGHGEPLRDTAKEAFTARFQKQFGI